MEKKIMIVDDEAMITSTISSLIKVVLNISVITYNKSEEALQSDYINNNDIDLIISDFMMPGMNGIDFLKKAKEKSPDAVKILLTGYADKENAIKSINEVGLYYYLEKPWDNDSLIKIIQNALEKKELSDELKVKYGELEDSNKQIIRLYDLLKKDYNQEIDNIKNLIISMANVIEAKDQYTEGHTRRVGIISREIGKRFNLSDESLQMLEISGIIHDIGKVGVWETILNKPGKLTNDEFDLVKKHTVIGENICKPLNCLQKCLDPIRHHHEKLDGSGYPDGLKGDDISLESRIIAVADIFDALHSKRPYRDKLTLDKTFSILENDAREGRLDREVVINLINIIESNETFLDLIGGR